MDNLEDRQREMRDRNKRERSKENKRETALPPLETAAPDTGHEVLRLKKRIAELQEAVVRSATGEQSIATTENDRGRTVGR